MRRFLTVLVVVLAVMLVNTARAQESAQLQSASYTCPDSHSAKVAVVLTTGTEELTAFGCSDSAVASAISDRYGIDYSYRAQLLRKITRNETLLGDPVNWLENNWVRLLITAGFGIAGLILLFTSVYFVRQQEEYIVERFGKYARTQKAGLRFKVPFIESVAEQFELRQQQEPVKCDTKTSDNVFLNLVLQVQFKVVDSFKAFYELADFEAQLKAYVFDEVRAAIPEMTLDEVFQKKEQLAVRVRKALAEKMSTFGYLIVDVLVTDITPPAEIQAAMNQVVTQQRLRLAATEEGEANKIRVVKAAEAKRDQEKLHGEGVAAFRRAIADGTKAAMEAIKSGADDLDDREVSALLMSTQYFDTMKEVAGASKSNTIFMPSGPGASGEVMTQVMASLIGVRREKPAAPPQ